MLQVRVFVCRIEPSMTSLAGESRDDSRGMLENTYENVASIKAAAASEAAGNPTSLCAKPYLEKGGGGVESSAVHGPIDDGSSAYQPGLPINYPSSSADFPSGHLLLDPFYEAYIIKPKPVYACNSNPNKPDACAGTQFSNRATPLVGFILPGDRVWSCMINGAQ